MKMHFVPTIDVTSLVHRAAMVVVAGVVVGALACGAPGDEGAGPPLTDTTEGGDAAGRAPALSWMSPLDGATVTSPVHVMFHASNFQISAVPEGTVETPRPGTGHYHVGVDTECLPVGVEIPQAEPWVHLSGGGTMTNMQVASGEHTLTLQVGDDRHHAIAGLCSTIAVTVTQ